VTMRGALLVCLLGVAACGFLPEDDYTGKRAGDGIAPWADLGPAQVCLGNEFLGPPASTPGGLCFAETTQEARCTGDDQCRSRELCVCGRCTIAYCATASDCPADRICSFSEHRCDLTCFSGSDCPDGAECRNGVCRGRCIDESDCQTGEVCSSQNVCVTADCEDDDGCLAGERCRVQRTPRQVLEPSPAIDGRQIVLWLEVSDENQLDQTAIWRAVSEDGLHFTMSPAAPVVEDGLTARAPSVIRTPEGWVMYYEVDAGAEIRVVTSLDGVSWTAPETAIGNGGITGQGLFNGPQTRAGLVPEQQTDFIFTVVGEELGFAGAGGLLGLYAILALRFWRTARLSKDLTGALICAGALAMLAFQVFENVGMTMGIMPIAGIPLPLMSYGGSSTLAFFCLLGLVQNVHMRRYA